ncbi:patatin-like phospholipase family protein [Spirosoma montaniterrae]|nr:patatin-like phospholipase family protein [Spirosoma montaniterrae]
METSPPVHSAPNRADTNHPRRPWWVFAYEAFKYLQALLSITAVVGVGLLAVLLIYGLTRVDQFQDLFIAMISDWATVWRHPAGKGPSSQDIMDILVRDASFLAALVLWAFTLAFTARWCLFKSRIPPVMIRESFAYLRNRVNRFQDALLFYAPRTLGLLPFVVISLAFVMNYRGVQYHNAQSWLWVGVVLTVGGLVWYSFNRIHRSLKRQGMVALSPTPGMPQQPMASVLTPTSDYEVAILTRQAVQTDQFPLFQRIVRVIIGVNAAMIILFCLPNHTLEPAHWFGFGAITISAFAGWSLLGMWANYQLRRRTISLLGFLIAAALLIYFSGVDVTRRAIRTVSDKPLARQSMVTYVDNWLINLVRTSKPGSAKPLPVFIVAAEGGGSRSAYWTAGVLGQLTDDIPGFRQHILAISGVSGGTVGGAFYVAQLHDRGQRTTTIRPTLDSIAAGDFLSPLVGAFCYPDPTLGGLCFFTPYFDRARWLEDSFRNRYRAISQSDRLDAGLTTLYQNRTDLPLLLLNSTIVELGQKAILSPVTLDAPSFYHAHDALADLGRDVPLKTAMSLSARFPVVTPAGLLHNADDKPIAYRLVDGGYYENTGLQTAYQMLQLVNSRLKDSTLLRQIGNRSVCPVIVFIQNGASATSGSVQAGNAFAPLAAFYNAWDRKTPATVGDLRYFVVNSKQPVKFHRFVLERRRNEVLPLGWYLSKAARGLIDQQVDRMAMPGSLNYTDFSAVQQMLP